MHRDRSQEGFLYKDYSKKFGKLKRAGSLNYTGKNRFQSLAPGTKRVAIVNLWKASIKKALILVRVFNIFKHIIDEVKLLGISINIYYMKIRNNIQYICLDSDCVCK